MTNSVDPNAEKQTQEATTNEVESVASEQAEPLNETSSDKPLELQVAELQAAFAHAQQEAATEKDNALRIAAEAENVRRRSAQEVEKARNFALEKFAGELLSVIDNLERGLAAIDPNDESTKAIAEGIEMTYKGFMTTIEKFGMEAVHPEGSPFDPQLHQAMGMQESADVPANTVLQVMQKGYLLNGRLLRPAMVMVSRAPTEGVDVQA